MQPQTIKLFFREECLVVDMFDIYGNDTTDPDEAFSIVVFTPDGRFIASECGYKDLIQKKLS